MLHFVDKFVVCWVKQCSWGKPFKVDVLFEQFVYLFDGYVDCRGFDELGVVGNKYIGRPFHDFGKCQVHFSHLPRVFVQRRVVAQLFYVGKEDYLEEVPAAL